MLSFTKKKHSPNKTQTAKTVSHAFVEEDNERTHATTLAQRRRRSAFASVTQSLLQSVSYP